MSEQEKIEKQKVERVKKDESKKDKLVKSSEKTQKAKSVKKDESKKDKLVKSSEQTKKVELVREDESKKDKLVKSSEKTQKVELVREDESKNDESKKDKLVKSSEKTQKVELVREDESKNDESKKDKLVKSSEKTQKVELVREDESKNDESKKDKLVKSSEQTKQLDAELVKKAGQDKIAVLSQKKGQFYSIGRRKNALARVYIQVGEGDFFVNKRELKNYFVLASFARTALMPLELVKFRKKINVKAFVKGGGVSGQAGAIKLGLSRALLKFNPEWKTKFRSEGFLTRDSRVVERKKYGQKGARAKFQYSKR